MTALAHAIVAAALCIIVAAAAARLPHAIDHAADAPNHWRAAQ
jgi:hypothetical protein